MREKIEKILKDNNINVQDKLVNDIIKLNEDTLHEYVYWWLDIDECEEELPTKNSVTRFLESRIMSKNDYLKCIISIINFLLFSDEEYEEEGGNFNFNSNVKLTKILNKYGYNLIKFTEHISKGEKLWDDHPTEFFSNNEKCVSYFIEKLNEYKI